MSFEYRFEPPRVDDDDQGEVIPCWDDFYLHDYEYGEFVARVKDYLDYDRVESAWLNSLVEGS